MEPTKILEDVQTAASSSTSPPVLATVDLAKYLTEEIQEEIARKVFEEELRKNVDQIITNRYRWKDNTGYGAIVDKLMYDIAAKYVDELSPQLESTIVNSATRLVNNLWETVSSNDDTDKNVIASAITYKLQSLSRTVIEENSDRLKDQLLWKILTCCDEMMLNAFCGGAQGHR